jgi:hypothetical protein
MIREPIVAGSFYPGTESTLRSQIDSLVEKSAEKQPAIGVAVPHAGYMYSAAVAAAVFSRIEIPDKVILLGPNHTGEGPCFSLYPGGKWRTPLGDVEVDEEFSDSLFSGCNLIKRDERAHSGEHSLEVQLPFLQYFNPGVRIVPLTIGISDIDKYRKVAEAIADTIQKQQKSALIVASTDMTHYEPQDQVKRKDNLAIDSILGLDADGLVKKVELENISMCGCMPVFMMIISAKLLGAKDAKLIKYQTSGDSSGDYSAVVGYAGIVIR